MPRFIDFLLFQLIRWVIFIASVRISQHAFLTPGIPSFDRHGKPLPLKLMIADS